MDAVCLETGRRGDRQDPPKQPDEYEPGPDYAFDLDASDIPAAEKPPSASASAPDPNTAVVGVPERSHPGESASNGKAESEVRVVVGMTRTLKVSLEARLKALQTLALQPSGCLVDHPPCHLGP